MRKFSSYGPVSTTTNYYAPRTELIHQACLKLLGEKPDEGGHYITVWAPRQTGKTWLLQQVAKKLRGDTNFDVVILTLQSTKSANTPAGVLEVLISGLRFRLRNDDLPYIDDWKLLPGLFSKKYLKKPLILVLDEFDAMQPEFINAFANEFRAMHTERKNELDAPDVENRFMLHGLATIWSRTKKL